MSHVRIDPDLALKLRPQASRQGRSLSNIVNLLLRRLMNMEVSPPARTSQNTAKH